MNHAWFFEYFDANLVPMENQLLFSGISSPKNVAGSGGTTGGK